MGIAGAQSHCDSRFKIHFYRISIKRHSSFNLENFERAVLCAYFLLLNENLCP